MTHIYALVSGQLVLYVGQTKQSLQKRECEHKRSKNNNACSKYIPDYIDWQIKQLEECVDTIAIERERYWYETLKPFYNKQCPGRSHKDYKKLYYQTKEGKATLRRQNAIENEKRKEKRRMARELKQEKNNVTAK